MRCKSFPQFYFFIYPGKHACLSPLVEEWSVALVFRCVFVLNMTADQESSHADPRRDKSPSCQSFLCNLPLIIIEMLWNVRMQAGCSNCQMKVCHSEVVHNKCRFLFYWLPFLKWCETRPVQTLGTEGVAFRMEIWRSVANVQFSMV